MDERHKKILQRNRTNLMRDLDPSDLYDRLLEKGVFTQDMIDEIKVEGSYPSRDFVFRWWCVHERSKKCVMLVLNVTPDTVSPTRALVPDVTRPDS